MRRDKGLMIRKVAGQVVRCSTGFNRRGGVLFRVPGEVGKYFWDPNEEDLMSLATGRQRDILIPLYPSPRSAGGGLTCAGIWSGALSEEDALDVLTSASPVGVGDEILVREDYGYAQTSGFEWGVVYRYGTKHPDMIAWRESKTLPRELVRFRFLVRATPTVHMVWPRGRSSYVRVAWEIPLELVQKERRSS